MYSISGGLGLISLIISFFWSAKDKPVSPEEIYNSEQKQIWTFFFAFLNMLLWILFRFVVLCARFNAWIENGDQYKAYQLPSGTVVWATPLYLDATYPTLQNAKCPADNTHYDYLPLAASSCTFLTSTFSINIMSGSNAGTAKFTIGLGLIIMIGLLMMVLGTGDIDLPVP
jgi:hypothetical protein